MEKLNMQTTDVVMETQLIPKELLGMRTQGFTSNDVYTFFLRYSSPLSWMNPIRRCGLSFAGLA